MFGFLNPSIEVVDIKYVALPPANDRDIPRPDQLADLRHGKRQIGSSLRNGQHARSYFVFGRRFSWGSLILCFFYRHNFIHLGPTAGLCANPRRTAAHSDMAGTLDATDVSVNLIETL